MSHPRLTAAQETQLARVETTTDGGCRYAPCRVTVTSGEVLDRVYVVAAVGYLRTWGVDPADDPTKRSVAITDVVTIESSPVRLPRALAEKVYAAGEAGMGFVRFVVTMRDGSRLPYVTGNAVDFPRWPPGVAAADAVDVEPFGGREVFRDRAPGPYESSAGYAWCLYDARP